MIFIKHRVNKLKEIQNLNTEYGAEIDLRSYGERLILNHEPFQDGILFKSWLEEYNNKFLICNVKEEGLESKCLDLLKIFKIKNYFFLDQSFPMLIKTCINGNKKTALRFSSYESIETVFKFKGLVDWIWIDYYEKYPLNIENFKKLKEYNFKICLVSPELQGYPFEEIEIAKDSIKKFSNKIDAVCTKDIEKWKQIL